MGSTDQLIRILIAFALAGLYFFHIVTGAWGVVLLVIAFVFLATSIFSFCPLYALFGISTCGNKKKAHDLMMFI